MTEEERKRSYEYYKQWQDNTLLYRPRSRMMCLSNLKTP